MLLAIYSSQMDRYNRSIQETGRSLVSFLGPENAQNTINMMLAPGPDPFAGGEGEVFQILSEMRSHLMAARDRTIAAVEHVLLGVDTMNAVTAAPGARFHPESVANQRRTLRDIQYQMGKTWFDLQGIKYTEETIRRGETPYCRLLIEPDSNDPLARALACRGVKLIYDPDEKGQAGGHWDRQKLELVVGTGYLNREEIPEILLHELRHFAFDEAELNGKVGPLMGRMFIEPSRGGDKARLPGHEAGRSYGTYLGFDELSAYSLSISKDAAVYRRQTDNQSRAKAAFKAWGSAVSGQRIARQIRAGSRSALNALNQLESEFHGLHVPQVGNVSFGEGPSTDGIILTPAQANDKNMKSSIFGSGWIKEGEPQTVITFVHHTTHTGKPYIEVMFLDGPVVHSLVFQDPRMLKNVDTFTANAQQNNGVEYTRAVKEIFSDIRFRFKTLNETAEAKEREFGNVARAAVEQAAHPTPENESEFRLATNAFRTVPITPRLMVRPPLREEDPQEEN